MDARLRFYRNVTGLRIYGVPIIGSNQRMLSIEAVGCYGERRQQLIISLRRPE